MTRFEFQFRRLRDCPTRLFRYARSWVSGAVWPRYRRPLVTLLSSPDGFALGDNLLLTTVAREIKKRNPNARVEILTSRPEVFDRNPDVDCVTLLRRGDRSNSRKRTVSYKDGFPYRKHFFHYCCDCLDIPGPIDLRTYLYPSVEHQEWANSVLSDLPGAPILISRGAGSHAYRKAWPIESWNELVASLVRLAPVIDIGADGSPLPFATSLYRSLLGDTSVHQLGALMSKARGMITMDSGPLHVAAAFALPTVCILGGVYPPEAISYPHSKILTHRPPCQDCAPLRHCDYDAKCLSAIKVQDVLGALKEVCLGVPALEAFSLRNMMPEQSLFP